MKIRLGDMLQTTLPAVGSAHWKCVKGTSVLKGDKAMKLIWFIVEENGVEYIVTNFRKVNGKIIFNRNGKCSKYPKKRAK